MRNDIFSGKIAFMYPAKMDGNRLQPTLNFYQKNKSLHMHMGIAFVDLNPESSYIVILKVFSSIGTELLSSELGGIPPDQIDPVMKTSFLKVNMFLTVDSPGECTFQCELIQMLQKTLDSKSVLFNVFMEDANVQA